MPVGSGPIRAVDSRGVVRPVLGKRTEPARDRHSCRLQVDAEMAADFGDDGLDHGVVVEMVDRQAVTPERDAEDLAAVGRSPVRPFLRTERYGGHEPLTDLGTRYPLARLGAAGSRRPPPQAHHHDVGVLERGEYLPRLGRDRLEHSAAARRGVATTTASKRSPSTTQPRCRARAWHRRPVRIAHPRLT